MNTEPTHFAFHVTPAATARIRSEADRSGAGGMALRIAARQEPDGSIAYGMGFDTVGADDEPLSFDGLTVLFAPGCEPLVEGTVLDFVELEPGRACFVFIPPRSDAAAPDESAAPRCGSGGCSGCSGH